jgi:hypothetical protein
MGEGGYKQINKTLNACAFDDYLSAQTAGLPELKDTEQLSRRVIRILGQNPGKVPSFLSPPFIFQMLIDECPVYAPRDEHIHRWNRPGEDIGGHRTGLSGMGGSHL